MAGTRLMIQTFALATLVLVTVWSIRYGFCRSTCTRGNLTKDIPRVPGYDPKANGVGTTGGMVENLPWEEIVCHPFQSLLGLLQTEEDADVRAIVRARARAASHHADVDADGHGEDPDPDSSQPVRWSMTLAVENATILPEWIEVLSNELFGDEGSGTSTTTTTTSTALSAMLKSQQQKMALKILPPPSSSSSSSTDDSFFDPNQLASKLGSVIEEAPLDRPSLVLYIPSHVLPDRYPVWKSFRTTPTTTTATMAMTITVLMPSRRPSGDEAAATTTDLRSLVEDWMARSIQQQKQKQKQQKQKRENQGLPPPETRAVRLTRMFPMEHMAAILMPLLFPLFMPSLVSWIKEIKRYKKLTTTTTTTTTRACSSDKPTQN